MSEQERLASLSPVCSRLSCSDWGKQLSTSRREPTKYTQPLPCRSAALPAHMTSPLIQTKLILSLQTGLLCCQQSKQLCLTPGILSLGTNCSQSFWSAHLAAQWPFFKHSLQQQKLVEQSCQFHAVTYPAHCPPHGLSQAVKQLLADANAPEHTAHLMPFLVRKTWTWQISSEAQQAPKA